MLAFGCLIPLVLLAVGGAAGWVVGGQHAEVVGAVTGGVIGLVGMLALLWGWERIRSRDE